MIQDLWLIAELRAEPKVTNSFFGIRDFTTRRLGSFLSTLGDLCER
mgnify:CR=1 FL=1